MLRAAQDAIRKIYSPRQRKLQIALKLRQPPFSETEAALAWVELYQHESLLQRLDQWIASGKLNAQSAEPLQTRLRGRAAEFLERLEGRTRPDFPSGEEHLKVVNFIRNAAEWLATENAFISPEIGLKLLADLEIEKESWEIKLGLRPMYPPEPRPVAPIEKPRATPFPPPRPPQTPLRERLRRALLSERTLYGILFLGIFLLFAAAVSFVIWGWKDFSALMRVSIPTGFTLLFFALGWYVRTQTPLSRSGIALSAIAALLVPIDLYTVYINFGTPPHYWAEFWLLASLVCLIAYILATLRIQSRFFVYLVGIAAGGLVLGGIEVAHQRIGFSRDWYSAGLSGLALGLILLAGGLIRLQAESRWRIFAAPFRALALLIVGALMPLTFGWRFIDRSTYDALHAALTVNWWLGSLIFAWGALKYRSRSLGFLAAGALPISIYLTQAAIFDKAGIHPAWHAFGWACLVLLYFVVAKALSQRADDAVLHDHSRSAARWGWIFLIISVFWPLADLTGGEAAAASHAVLALALVLATVFWRQPGYLYGVGLLGFSSVTFALSAFEFSIPQASIGWISLSLVLVVAAVSLGNRSGAAGEKFAPPLLYSGYGIAALALLPPLFPYAGGQMAYALGNWLGLSAWGAVLTARHQPGFGKFKTLFHWFAALPLPFWVWILFTNRRPADFSLALALAVLAWGMVFLGHRLSRSDVAHRHPWRLVGILISFAAVITAASVASRGYTLPITILSAGLLYFADAFMARQNSGLAPAGLVSAWGVGFLLSRAGVHYDPGLFALALLTGLYFLAGLWAEWRKFSNGKFLSPLYKVSHLLTGWVALNILARPISVYPEYSDAMRLWAAAALIGLGAVYALYAWGRNRAWWAYVGVWLGIYGGGLIVSVLSQGSGRSAALAALMAIGLVLAERGLQHARTDARLARRWRVLVRLAWRLYRYPLLVGGWTISAGTIGLALVRNLMILEGSRIQQIWAMVALLLIVALYAGAVYLFRQKRFVWLSAALVFAPWTVLTHLGWFTPYRLRVAGFAVSWLVLAWLLYGVSRGVQLKAGRAYALPVKVVTHLLVSFALLWACTDAEASRYAFGLALGLYALAAWVLHGETRRVVGEISSFGKLRASKYLYPAAGLFPIWSMYLLNRLPGMLVEHYGLLLLTLVPLGLLAGRWLRKVAPRSDLRAAYAFPAYLAAYFSLFVGTLLILIAEQPALLAMALLYDALLMLISTLLFRHPAWLVPALVFAPLALLLALDVAGVPANREGWWLIGLAAAYLLVAWLLRRVDLRRYSIAPLWGAMALAALGLLPSSQDQIGALWGYSGAALIYVVTAFWLERPVLLTPAAVFVTVPYVIVIQRSGLADDYFGLALYPGALLAVALGWLLERRYGVWDDFPWSKLLDWPGALLKRWWAWWGLPLYALGFGLASFSVFYTNERSDIAALNLILLAGFYGWGIYRFRLRSWMVITVLVVHLAAVMGLDALGWWNYPDWAWLLFTPAPIVMACLGLWLERRLAEGAPFAAKRFFVGWSRPLYLFVMLDFIIAQASASWETPASVWVTIIHALLMLLLASAWLAPAFLYLSAGLGALALLQWVELLSVSVETMSVYFAYLALGYGLVGYGVHLYHNIRNLPVWLASWARPLQRSGLLLSFGVLFFTVVLGFDLTTWTVRALFGMPFREIVALSTVQMVVSVFSLLGLLYLSDALVYRRIRQSYAAVGMLLAGWLLFAFYTQAWDGLRQAQWYALPTGLYLLGISAMEWHTGSKSLARGLDYAALFLMFGSLFWQTLIFGWQFALLLGAEGLGIFLLGSARRLRRFFYAGILAVVLATLGQLINALQAVNQWVSFGMIGLLLVGAAILVERNLDDIKEWQESIEDWE